MQIQSKGQGRFRDNALTRSFGRRLNFTFVSFFINMIEAVLSPHLLIASKPTAIVSQIQTKSTKIVKTLGGGIDFMLVVLSFILILTVFIYLLVLTVELFLPFSCAIRICRVDEPISVVV